MECWYMPKLTNPNKQRSPPPPPRYPECSRVVWPTGFILCYDHQILIGEKKKEILYSFTRQFLGGAGRKMHLVSAVVLSHGQKPSQQCQALDWMKGRDKL